jgi:hypothetical protein
MRGEVMTPVFSQNIKNKKNMKNYIVTMRRTFVTDFEIQAETREQAIKKFEELGNSIYSEELDQLCVTNEVTTIREDASEKEIPFIIF